MDTLETVIEGGGREHPSPSYAEALTAYLERLNAAEAEHYARDLPALTAPHYVILGRGHKYDRVGRVEAHETRGCAVAFVEKATGLIWKPASYKAPIRNFPRGNIYALSERPAEARLDPILRLTDARW
jgi:hypothetical protein